MVRVRLCGGLGNQMFQYAAGRSLSIHHETSLSLDLSAFETYELRRYGLHAFSIVENILGVEEARELNRPFHLPLHKKALFKLTQRLGLASGPKHHRERMFGFDKDFFRLPSNVYLLGFYQSYKYFEKINDVITGEFSLRSPVQGKNKEMAEKIAATESVSLHVRRTDYVTEPATCRVHGVCEKDYYERCVETLAGKRGGLRLFVFSDDPPWCRDNLKFGWPMTVVDHNGPDEAHEDLRLMSLCKHNIMANSSFSWWGAWLNKNPDKKVLAPQKWANDAKHSTKDLIPPGWETI